MSTVMFDVDGVVADFYRGYRQVERDLGLEPTVSERWDDYLNREVWDAIKASDTFWRGLPVQPEMGMRPWLWQRLNVLPNKHDVYYVTSREGVRVKWQTEDWLRGRGIMTPTVIVTDRKGEAAKALHADYCIDDKPGNAIYTSYHSPETKSYLLLGDGVNRLPNDFGDRVGSRVRKVRTVEEYLEDIEVGR